MKNIFKFSGLLLLFVIILFYTSCRKSSVSPKEQTYTITGRLYEDCSMQPVANQRMDIHQAYITTFSGLKGGFLAETTTDENGNFRFEYKDKRGMEIRMRTLFGNSFSVKMLNIPERKNISGLNVFKSSTVNINVYLSVTNAYTEYDTLSLTDFNNIFQPLKIPGPFTSGLLYTANNFKLLNYSYDGGWFPFGYQLNQHPEITSSHIVTACDTLNLSVLID